MKARICASFFTVVCATAFPRPFGSSARSSCGPLSLGKTSTAADVANLWGSELRGKVAVVTGGNSGIGLETCRVLAEQGCKVVLCARDAASGRAAATALGPGEVVVAELDLANLTSVDKAAASIALLAGPRVDFLVLNAGIMATPTRQTTPQGFELQVGTNHFGHFRLTEKLWPQVAQAGCRVVALSSTAHTFGSVDVADLHFDKGRAYSPWGAYGQSKACNLLFAKELALRLAPSGASAFSVHPGVIATNLWREKQGPSILNRLGFLSLNKLLPKLISDKSVEQGAATTVYACLAPRLDESFNGAYLSDCDVATPAAAMASAELRQSLWAATEAQIAKAMAM